MDLLTADARAEIAYLHKRFGPSFQPHHGSTFEFTLSIRPSDPDLPSYVRGSNLRIDFRPTPSFVRLDSVGGLPPPIVAALDKIIQHRSLDTTSGVQRARDVIRWWDNFASDVLKQVVTLQAEAAEKAKAAAAAAAAAAEASSDEEEGEPLPAASVAAAAAARPSAHGAVSHQPTDALFGAAWTYQEQAAFERVLREVFHTPSRSAAVTDPKAWQAVAEKLNGIMAAAAGSTAGAAVADIDAADTPTRAARTSAECLARFLVLREVSKRWRAAAGATHEAAAAVVAAASEPEPEGRSAALPRPHVDEPAAAPAAPAPAPADAGLLRVRPSVPAEAGGRFSARAIDAILAADEEADARRSAARLRAGGMERRAAAAAAAERGDGDGSEGEESEGEGGESGSEAASSDESESEGEAEAGAEAGRTDARREARQARQEARRQARAGAGDTAAAAGGAGAGGSGESEAEEDAEAAGGPGGMGSGSTFLGVDLRPAHRGFHVGLESVSLFGVGTLACSQVDVTAQCDRCSAVVAASMFGVRAGSAADAAAAAAAAEAGPGGVAAAPKAGSVEASIAAAKEWKSWCPKCSLLLSLSFRPTLVHEGSPSVGYIDAQHASVTTLNGLRFMCTCLECGGMAELPRMAPPGTWEASCRTCFSRLRVDCREAQVAAASRTAPPTDMMWRGAKHAAGGGPGAKGAAKIQAGKPLPHNGTCKHYGQSYRWLRFPCCGVAFPCDVCHDEGSDHLHEYARRMICGHCAREQPFSGTAPCVACGRYMTRSGGPRAKFWEGGTGQRNRALLSRKDPRKYRDGKAKTKSKKAERVGTAAKVALERRAEQRAGGGGGGGGGAAE